MSEVTFSHVYRLISFLVYESIFKVVFYYMNLLFGEAKIFLLRETSIENGQILADHVDLP